jgi:hypothetical protein
MNGWLRAAIREVDEVMAGCKVETTPIKDHKGEREQPSEMPRLNSKKKVCYMSCEIATTGRIRRGEFESSPEICLRFPQ